MAAASSRFRSVRKEDLDGLQVEAKKRQSFERPRQLSRDRNLELII